VLLLLLPPFFVTAGARFPAGVFCTAGVLFTAAVFTGAVLF